MQRLGGDRLKYLHASVVLMLLAGCATMPSKRDPAAGVPAPPVLKSAEVIERIFSSVPQPAATPSVEAERASDAVVLTLAQVQSVARQKNPTFAEFAASRQAARAEVLQALAYANPDVEVGLDSALGLFQPIESPAKRRSRRNAAEASKPIVEWEEEVFRATLAANVAKAYHTVLYYEHAVDLAKESLRTEQEISQIVGRRVDGGEAPEIDRIKAQVELLKASRTVQVQERQQVSARAVLNTLCGRSLPPGFVLEDTLDLGSRVRSPSLLAGVNMDAAKEVALAQHPVLRRLDAVLRQKELIVLREQKASHPTLRFGVPLGLEIPLWNRNKGGIEAAKAEVQKTQAEVERARQEILRDIETSTQTYESVREQLAAFQDGLRAASAESLRIETFRYQEGEVDFLRLLDARRTTRQTEVEYLQTLYDAQIARIELERAIGIGGEKE